MNWGRIEGQWDIGRGKAERHWGKMNAELAAIDSNAEYRVGRLQEKYRIATQEAKGQVEEFKNARRGYLLPELNYL